ncbi:Protein of unknown function, nitrogen regulatory protein PII-related protein [Methanothermus fervidus DSM 2088]|uniref:Nitrogen regulatory protein P-II n=1 Tax=Methanothermus fervidus (strain ATCC 43054 / DSM 2088 / JCM 10308 / V24 S) TaxID=523846 RepID=E3GX65_METFV|nr:MJ1244 family protein [Methanothermus fervidus]ADP78060.1 Protein of unknown function, nitrogen regulatory protein PII-related protein [Methanothermus fervidus DSM 2088]
MKVHLQIFVEIENLGRVINILSKEGVTGFYLIEYRGVSPQEWEGFTIQEDPKSVVSFIKDVAQNAILVSCVVDKEKAYDIRKEINRKLSDVKYTIMEIPIKSIVVNFAD